MGNTYGKDRRKRMKNTQFLPSLPKQTNKKSNKQTNPLKPLNFVPLIADDIVT